MSSAIWTSDHYITHQVISRYYIHSVTLQCATVCPVGQPESGPRGPPPVVSAAGQPENSVTGARSPRRPNPAQSPPLGSRRAVGITRARSPRDHIHNGRPSPESAAGQPESGIIGAHSPRGHARPPQPRVRRRVAGERYHRGP